MRAKGFYVAVAALLATAAAVYAYFFAGPYRFVDRHLDEQSLQHLRSSATTAPWRSSPSETAVEYLYWWPQIDRPNRSKLDISTSYRSPEEAIVTVIDYDTQDDSISRTCDRFTLRRQAGLWLPVRHQAAWQGRGRFGWTTTPAS